MGCLALEFEVRPVDIAERDDLDAGDLAEPADEPVATPAGPHLSRRGR